MPVDPSVAWDLLVDSSRWTEWGPSVTGVDVPGGRLRAARRDAYGVPWGSGCRSPSPSSRRAGPGRGRSPVFRQRLTPWNRHRRAVGSRSAFPRSRRPTPWCVGRPCVGSNASVGQRPLRDRFHGDRLGARRPAQPRPRRTGSGRPAQPPGPDGGEPRPSSSRSRGTGNVPIW